MDSSCFIGSMQAALVEWAKEELLKLVLVVAVDMVAEGVMGIIMAVLLMVAVPMEMLIYLVSLVAVVEMIALLVQLLVVVLSVSLLNVFSQYFFSSIMLCTLDETKAIQSLKA